MEFPQAGSSLSIKDRASSQGGSGLNSRPDSPSESASSEPSKRKERQLNPKHLKCLARNQIEFDHDLCQNIDKPTLQVLYQRYCAVNDIHRQVDEMIKDRTWKGASITKTEVVTLFVAKTTWHNFYRVQMPAAEKQEDMRAWLTEADDAPSDADLWGEARDLYTLKDLDSWLKEKVGKKGKVVKKGKAKVEINQSTAKGKEKEVAPEPKAVRSHKKKLTTG